MLRFLLVVTLILGSPTLILAEAPEPASEAVAPSPEPIYLPATVDIAGYYDTRDYTGITVNTFFVLPAGFSFFSFIDIDNAYYYDAAPGAPDASRGDATQAYTELNLQWGDYLNFPLEVHGQWALGTNPYVTDLARVGLRLHAPPNTWGAALARANLVLHLAYFPYVQRLNFEKHPGGYESQISLFYRWVPFAELTDSRVYVSGWADFDVRTKADNDFYTEHQLGVRVVAGLHVVAEYRHFSFLPEQDGVGIGLQYQFNLGSRLPQW